MNKRSVTTNPRLKVADQVWIATALLHRAHPERDDFTVSEIVNQVKTARLSDEYRHSIRVHALQHCVATLPPNPGAYRMLTSTGPSTRRLFRTGDTTAPGRKGKITPHRYEIPAAYHELLDWYASQYDVKPQADGAPDTLLALRGSGQRLWADERPDAYVARLREGWT
jgi:hypothetical protein